MDLFSQRRERETRAKQLQLKLADYAALVNARRARGRNLTESSFIHAIDILLRHGSIHFRIPLSAKQKSSVCEQEHLHLLRSLP